MQTRLLGKTGEQLSVVGFGAIVLVGEDQAFARETVARAIDSGVNYFDMGPAYGRGEAEEEGGPAMEPYRDKIFLAGGKNWNANQGRSRIRASRIVKTNANRPL